MNDKTPKLRNIVSQYLLRATRTLEQAENDAERQRMLTNQIAAKLAPEFQAVQSTDSKKPSPLSSGTDSDGGPIEEDIEQPY